MLFLPGRIHWNPACAVWPWNAVGEPGALFCRVECLETRGTVAGRSLHGMSLVVVVFLVEELILYVELLAVAGLTCRNTCRNTLDFEVILVGCVLFVETPLYSKID